MEMTNETTSRLLAMCMAAITPSLNSMGPNEIVETGRELGKLVPWACELVAGCGLRIELKCEFGGD